MKIERCGIILFTDNYQSCVAFYQHQVGLRVLEKLPTLTYFEFGGAYLIVEMGGISSTQEKLPSENPAVLRFDVRDVEAEAQRLRTLGVTVTVRDFVWGKIGVFQDPDWNRCELKNATA